MGRVGVFLLMLLPSTAHAVEKFAGPAEAAALAVTDVVENVHPDVTTLRYLWAIDRSADHEHGLTMVVNGCASRSAILYRLNRLYGGILYRVDLASLATDKQDLKELIQAWEDLADIDPYFHANKVLLAVEPTNQPRQAGANFDLSGKRKAGVKVVDQATRRVLRSRWYVDAYGNRTFLGNFWKEVPPDPIRYFQPTGDLYRDFRALARAQAKQPNINPGVPRKSTANAPAQVAKQVQRIFAPYAGQALLDLAVILKSEAPILRADWFASIVSSTADDGRYYEFRGIVDSIGNQTAEQIFEQDLGVNIADGQKAAMLRSLVTGKPRVVEFAYGTRLRPTVGPGFYSITRDIFDGEIDDDQHSLKNLIRVRFDGSEAIGFLDNGLQVYGLFDGAGGLAREAPPQLVADHSAPSLAPTRLQAAVSCVRCHAREEGWLPVPNDIRTLLKSPHLRVLGEGVEFLDRADAEELLRLYAGDLALPLQLARDTLQKAVFVLTGQPSVSKAFGWWAGIFDRYYYDLVDAKQALIELGYLPNDSTPYTVQFTAVVPPLVDETPTIAALRAGLPVIRRDWERDYAEAATRAVFTDSAAVLARLKTLGTTTP